MEERKTNKSFYILSVIIVLLVVAITVGASYAYFTASIAGNNNATTSVITSGNLSLELVDGNVVGTTQNMIPGDTITKQFSVTNTGTLATTYDIYLSEVLNTFVDKSDLVYSISSSDGGYNTVSDQVVPSTSGNESKLISAQSINAGEIHTYTLTIKFLNKDENQDDNKGATFSGKLQINDYKEYVIPINENGYNYWNDGFTGILYEANTTPTVVYPNYNSFATSENPVFIRSTYENGVPIKHETCLYYNDVLFCGLGYGLNEEKKLKTDMTDVIGIEPTCKVDYSSISYRCSYGNYYCAADAVDGGLFCGNETIECNSFIHDNGYNASCATK